jgi:hypothetical protein
MTFPYPTGGWDVSSVSPSDATLTLRGLRRRLSEATGGAQYDQGTAGAVIDGAAGSMGTLAAALGTVLVHDDARVDLPEADATGPFGPPQGPIDRLAAVAGDLAGRIEKTDAGAWSRTATVSSGPGAGTEVSALDLARAAVFVGVRALREVEGLSPDDDR